ncbi:hypothetical protein GOB23_19750 [Sinorhizobium meliloti]|nr:hypothetical protein [Sinorhizobium meliloti]MDW9542623.1 hypothetical protein [Sinorhizobium meliloti]
MAKASSKKACEIAPIDPMPARVDPCLATLVDKPPKGTGLRSEGHVCGRHGRCKRKLTSVQACGQALTFVQPHVARSRRRGPLWSSWIGSQSATRASEHSSHCWFIQSRSLTDCP